VSKETLKRKRMVSGARAASRRETNNTKSADLDAWLRAKDGFAGCETQLAPMRVRAFGDNS
jgi:hypothetical protein